MPNSQSPEASEFVVVLVTVPDADTAARLGRAVVEERLAACVNVIPGLRSIYHYGGKLCDDAEVLCLVKTRRALYPALRDRLTALHPYEVPEIIAVPLAEGNAPYLAWLAEGTAAPAGSAGP
jgi:periplasmic divalent cation tolerance protein